MKYDFDEVGKSVGKSISKLFERYGKDNLIYLTSSTIGLIIFYYML